MTKRSKRSACRVEFISGKLGWSAVAFDGKGRSFNVRNYPRSYGKPDAAEMKRATRSLMRGCAASQKRR